MLHLRHLGEAQIETESVVTIGVFDGVHLGHRTMVRRLVEEAQSSNRLAVVLSFHPHPDKVLGEVDARYYLSTPEQRAKLLIALGVDVVITHPFDEEIRQIRAEQFVDQLVKHLRLKELWVGSDFALGYEREGTVEFLRQRGKRDGFSVTAIELIMSEAGDDSIHSSQLRDLVRQGEMRQAKGMLGRAYSVEGKVIHGQQRGRKIGIPTANLEVWEEQIIPPNGVYAGLARLGQETRMAATNIGMRPTFGGDKLSIEAHLLDFDRDIYGASIELSFEARLRPERKFNGLDELLTQIKLDIEQAKAVLGKVQPD
ncbi:MAG: bifunctional riboflavin kinase/FAD synthetase [Chloroflexi bacterium]|nr:bifunctional riboflavin kinase/FAD synthetase [Chloroflexota bacterium]